MLALGLLIGTLAFGQGLGLAPDEEAVLPPAPWDAPDPAKPPEEPEPVLPEAVLFGLAAAALLAARGIGAALGLRPPEDTLVVFVPGHGQGRGEEVYGEFVDLMGLDSEDARYFDYRWVTGDPDPHRASALAPTGATVVALNAYLGGVASGERPVWLVGFSKGGSVVAELVAAWDRGAYGPPPKLAGAMLLDPPIATGIHGALQSVGSVVGPIPDDGGYDPVDCEFLWWFCRDDRAYLGRASGVEVLVVRNPRAGLTSFFDRPPGLRVYDSPDDGPGPLGQLFRNPFLIFRRLSRAHESVLSDPAVARCLVEEMWHPGSCSLQHSYRDWSVFRPLRVRARSPLARAV